MKDTLMQTVSDNIPDAAIRLSVLVVIIVFLAIGVILLRFKMMQLDARDMR